MVDRDHDRIRETERTTVVHTDGERRGGRGLLIAIILLLAVAALLFFLFGGNVNRAADEVGVNVNVEAPEMPDVQVPDVDVPNVKVPDVDVSEVNVNLPDVDVNADTKEEPNR